MGHELGVAQKDSIWTGLSAGYDKRQSLTSEPLGSKLFPFVPSSQAAHAIMSRIRSGNFMREKKNGRALELTNICPVEGY